MSSDHLFRNATLALQEILAKIDQDRTSFEKDSRELQEFKEKMQQTRPGRSTKVRLDVGGCVFATSVSTLQSERSLLSAMFSGNFELTKDPDGCYFIDRNPEYFRKILDYLRKGKKLSLGGMSRFQLEAFYDEAVYYELESLVELLKNAMEVQRERLFQFQWQFDSSTDVDFSDDRYTVTAVSMKFRTVLGAKSFSSGKHCWKVRVIHSGQYFSVGVAQASIARTGGYIGNGPDGWGVNDDGLGLHNGAHTGPVRSSANTRNQTMEHIAFSDGNVIEVMLDMDTHTVSFKCDNLQWPVMYISSREVREPLVN